jgi:DNA invertase Pin-like site-specific DNA recombinase
VKFIATDMPDANDFSVNIMALVAQQEREAISARTKAALAAAKARGTRLGNPQGVAAFKGRIGSAAGSQAAKRQADEHARMLRSAIERIQAAGHVSLGAIARELNKGGEITRRGGKWHPSSVRNLLSRLNEIA